MFRILAALPLLFILTAWSHYVERTGHVTIGPEHDDTALFLDATAGSSVLLPPPSEMPGAVLFVQKTDGTSNPIDVTAITSSVGGWPKVSLRERNDGVTLMSTGVAWRITGWAQHRQHGFRSHRTYVDPTTPYNISGDDNGFTVRLAAWYGPVKAILPDCKNSTLGYHGFSVTVQKADTTPTPVTVCARPHESIDYLPCFTMTSLRVVGLYCDSNQWFTMSRN